MEFASSTTPCSMSTLLNGATQQSAVQSCLLAYNAMLPAALTSPAFERRLVKFGEFFFLISSKVQAAAQLEDTPMWLAPVVAVIITLIAHQVIYGILSAYIFNPILGRKQTIWYSSQQTSRFSFNDKSAAPVAAAAGNS